jgi:tape measure domain-containing protein
MANLTSTIKLALDSSAVKRGIAGIKANFRDLGKSMGGIAVNAAKFATALGVAGAAFAAFKTVQFLSDSVKAAAAYESLAVSFEVLTGSASKARNVLKEIEKFGATTSLEQGDLQEATKTLMAMGIAVDDTMPILKMLGDVSLGNGEKLKSLALVFGQISAAEKLTGGDLLQLINMGFNPLQNIAKKTGKTMSELRKEMSKGEISIADVREAFEDATGKGGLFEGMLSRMAGTAEGKFSNLVDNVDALKRSLGTGLLEGVKSGLDAINEQLGSLTGVFKTAGEDMGMMLAAGLSENTEPIEKVFDYIASKFGEMVYASLQEALAKGMESGLSGLLRINADVADSVGGDGLFGFNGPRAASNFLADKVEGIGMRDVDRSEFQDLYKGIFGSEEKLEQMLTELKGLRQEAQRRGSVPVLPEGYAY